MGESVDTPRPTGARSVAGADRRADRVRGLVVLAGAFFAAIGVAWQTRERTRVTAPPPPSTEGLVGFPSRLDAASNLERARGLTRRDRFRGFVAEGVASDGTLDVGRPGSKIRYVFQSARGKGPQPPAIDGRPHRRTYCGKQIVHLDARGIHADPDQPMAMCSRLDDDALSEPACSTRDVWRRAIEKGAPATGHAIIEYYVAVAGPAWRFQLPGTRHRFSLSGDCTRELEGRDIYGSVP